MVEAGVLAAEAALALRRWLYQLRKEGLTSITDGDGLELVTLSRELEILKMKPGLTERERRKICAQKQKLVTAELRKCQKDQLCKPVLNAAEGTSSMTFHWS